MKIIQKIFKYLSVKPRIGGTLIALGIFIFVAFPSNAFAAYNPSYIMPDDVFVNSGTMSEAQIQSFLVANNSYLKGYTETRSNLMGYPERYQAQDKSAAHIIWWTSQEYKINPQVILVTLQKEQSLITTSWLNQYGLDWAMGYAVPDSGERDYDKVGFSRQVDWGAYQLKSNLANANNTPDAMFPTTGCYKVTPYCTGNTITIDGIATYLGNGATASLYRYTPHNTYGGNFRTNFTNWFGSIDYAGTTPVFRFFKSADNTHFYTASEAEKINIMLKWPTIYKYEGVAYSLNNTSGKNNTPLYRFYNKRNNTHFYTASEAEKNNVMARLGYIYQYEGVAYNVCGDPTSCIPVYRFWNTNGTHFYTISEAEKNNVMARWGNIFKYEGIGYYISN